MPCRVPGTRRVRRDGVSPQRTRGRGPDDLVHPRADGRDATRPPGRRLPRRPPGPNPRVGCVILSADGDVLAEGHHRGAGTAHAEVDALANLAAAGASAQGATAVVTLEPCDHEGRTGPCVQALLSAGVAEVIYAQDDPTQQAGGGAATLEAAGVRVRRGLCSQDAARLNRPWLLTVTRGRPW